MKGKIVEMWHRIRHRSPVKRWIFWSTLVFLIIICVNKKDNVFRWVEAGLTLKKQERQIETYIELNKALDEKINSLSTNRDTLETFARENFLFSAPDEDVYIVDE